MAVVCLQVFFARSSRSKTVKESPGAERATVDPQINTVIPFSIPPFYVLATDTSVKQATVKAYDRYPVSMVHEKLRTKK